ncbi:Protein-L-isoaspartate(D-aspartate) O-methyltransferase [Carpediemonas membranifera]|uniref:protein-L-isoaspartate(D-aspartate) O-methyltransferase n=1 Tax=Carpediemonas membranifera TaxID=201153 RepID=A0A8J6AV70_9EUKA|nr:Protein-L-isoaspartate(D-aspartate) O-methyltransferase [Carpediemonas membranifera]|eukprot:KAG9392400.1 Protein-L-isoaspartate(D-aspartate) O-methyltransferase [Carpediemonas membranifera]
MATRTRLLRLLRTFVRTLSAGCLTIHCNSPKFFTTMSWTCSASSHSRLVQNLRNTALIRTDEVFEAFLQTDRRFYCPDSPYQDAPQYIGFGATISAPHMHAIMLEYISENVGRDFDSGPTGLADSEESRPVRVLDVGSGSGWTVAAIANLLACHGLAACVVGIDHCGPLVDQARDNIMADPVAYKYLEDGTIELRVGDGRHGAPDLAPFDIIHVGATAQSIPQPLLSQLRVGGIMLIPLQDQGQYLWLVKKTPTRVEKHRLMGVSFVPLCDISQQLGHGSAIA